MTSEMSPATGINSIITRTKKKASRIPEALEVPSGFEPL